jgi:putative oxidoreductase
MTNRSNDAALLLARLAVAALILGVAPRLTALLLITFALVASLISHSFWTFADPAQAAQQQTQFLKNMANVGGLLFYFASGPGSCAPAPRLGKPCGARTGLSR